MRHWLLVLLSLGCSGHAMLAADWSLEVQAVSPLAGGGSWRALRFSAPGQEAVTGMAVAVRAAAMRAGIVEPPLPERSTAPRLRQVAERLDALVAVNGGYFTPRFAPVGWLRIAGSDRSAWSEGQLLSGLLLIDGDGLLTLAPREAGREGMVAGLQSGPFLVDPGGRPGIRRDSGAARRTIVGSDGAGGLLLAVTGELGLKVLAELLLAQPQAFGVARVERALNLDGGPSTGMAVKTEQGWLGEAERWPVRDILVLWRR